MLVLKDFVESVRIAMGSEKGVCGADMVMENWGAEIRCVWCFRRKGFQEKNKPDQFKTLM